MCIRAWVVGRDAGCPVCRKPVDITAVTPDEALKTEIANWHRQQVACFVMSFFLKFFFKRSNVGSNSKISYKKTEGCPGATTEAARARSPLPRRAVSGTGSLYILYIYIYFVDFNTIHH
jgi:hypothetical protein